MAMLRIFAFLILLCGLAYSVPTTALVCGTFGGDYKKDLKDAFERDTGGTAKEICIAEPVNAMSQDSIRVYGTQYYPSNNDLGKIFTQLINNNQTIDNALCTTTVFFPNNTAKLFTKAPLLFTEQGLYVKDFQVSLLTEIGIYPVIVNCDLAITQTAKNSSAFALINGTLNSGTLADTFFDDNSRLVVQEGGLGGQKTLSIRFNFTSLNISANSSLSIEIDGQWSDNSENLKVFLFNYSTSDFSIQLPNQISQTPVDVTVTNLYDGKISDVIQNGTLRVRIADLNPDGTSSVLKIDFIRLQIAQPTVLPIEHLKGGGEIQLSNSFLNNASILQINSTINNSKIIQLILQGVTEEEIGMSSYCALDNITLVTEVIKTRSSLDQTIVINETAQKICNYGCNQIDFSNAICNPSPLEANVFLLALILVAIVIGVVAFRRR